MSYNPFALKYRYKMDASKEVIQLTMTKGSLLKCFAPTLILLGVGAALTAAEAVRNKRDLDTDEAGNPYPVQ